MARDPITVFLVEDSAIASNILVDLLATAPEITVVGTAPNGEIALAQIPQLQPDVVCTDLRMPRMDGLELTRHLLATCPRPILVFSEAVQPDATETIEQLLQAGALAVLAKPKAALRADYENLRQTLINQIKLLAGVTVISKPHRRCPLPSRSREVKPLSVSPALLSPPLPQRHHPSSHHPSSRLPGPTTTGYQIIAIGASTGGPQAVHQLLKALPRDYPLPIVCTQHISKGFLQGLVDWQNANCALQVKIAEAREVPVGGRVYYAPDDVHLLVNEWGQLSFSYAPPVGKHRPSVTVMFEAIARHYGRLAVGVLLTGMGQDGAQGLVAISQAGGLTVAQDEASCVVFGMPKVAIELGAAQHILPVDQIGGFLAQLQALPQAR